jgi:hypothetical protein
MITCDNVGANFDGDIRAEWHPDGALDSEAELAGHGAGVSQPGEPSDETPERRSDQISTPGNHAAGSEDPAQSGG